LLSRWSFAVAVAVEAVAVVFAVAVAVEAVAGVLFWRGDRRPLDRRPPSPLA
jgi:hypothetical protein